MTCKAIRCQDEMQCPRCGLAWDVNDPEPPACLTERERGRRAIAELKRQTDAIPDTESLPWFLQEQAL